MAAQQTAAAPVVPPPQEVAEVDPFARQSSEHDAKWESAEEENATLAFRGWLRWSSTMARGARVAGEA